jgi:exopolysaccharide production protein ExoZ
MTYVWGVDLIRFAAALMVVVFHFSWQQPDPQVFFDPGWVGVEIFFVISGFVIMASAGKATPVEFLERRFARLYPAAIGCALVSFAVLRPFEQVAAAQQLHVSAAPGTLARSILLLKGPFMVSALWTLPIEIAFYTLILLVVIVRRLDRVTGLAGLLIVWSGLYLIPFALTEYGVSPLHVGPLGYDSYNLTLLRHGCFFGVGMLIWQVLNQRPRAIDLTMLVSGIILCCTEIIARSAELRLQYAYPVQTSALAGGALATFTLAVCAIWLLGRLNDRVKLNQPTRHVLRRLGLITFPLYLMHEAVGGVAYGLLRQSGHGQGLALLIGVSVSLVAGLFVIEAIEPWLRRRLLAAVHPLLAWLAATASLAHVLGTFGPKHLPQTRPLRMVDQA